MGNLCDSVVGIGVKNTEAIEIKDIRSLELELRGDALLRADGDQVTRLEGHSRFQGSNILELGIVSEHLFVGEPCQPGMIVWQASHPLSILFSYVWTVHKRLRDARRDRFTAALSRLPHILVASFIFLDTT